MDSPEAALVGGLFRWPAPLNFSTPMRLPADHDLAIQTGGCFALSVITLAQMIVQAGACGQKCDGLLTHERAAGGTSRRLFGGRRSLDWTGPAIDWRLGGSGTGRCHLGDSRKRIAASKAVALLINARL